MSILHASPESRRASLPQPAEVYADFYEMFGSQNFLPGGWLAAHVPLLDGRVLHTNDPADRSVHVVAYELEGNSYTHKRRLPNSERGFDEHCWYDAGKFAVATTDGRSIRTWHVRSALAVHPGRIDPIGNPYSRETETLYLELGVKSVPDIHWKFARASGLGTLRIGDTLGWILGAELSLAEKELVLAPCADTTDTRVAA